MAGSERSGPLAASPTLFDGRPWAVVSHHGSNPGRGERRGGHRARPPGRRERRTPEPGGARFAVARTSHLPHLLAVLVAGRLADAPAEHLALSGQGVRDVTRIAGGTRACGSRS